jgi:thymidylate kinase
MEQEPEEFYRRVRQAYRDLATRESNRVVLINGARNADEIENEVWEMLCSRFPALATNPQSAKTTSPASDRDPHC